MLCNKERVTQSGYFRIQLTVGTELAIRTSWVAFASPPVVGLIATGLRGFFMASCVGWFSLFISPRVMSFTWKKNKSNDFATQRIRVQFLRLQNIKLTWLVMPSMSCKLNCEGRTRELSYPKAVSMICLLHCTELLKFVGCACAVDRRDSLPKRAGFSRGDRTPNTCWLTTYWQHWGRYIVH